MNISPVAFNIFGLAVNWYGIIIAGATLLAILLCLSEAKRVGINPDHIVDLALLCIPIAVVCARIYYVVFEWSLFTADNFGGLIKNIFSIRSGGLAIYGAIIGGLIAVFIFYKWRKISFLKLLDLIVPSLILAQGIGRWGNFFNQEAYGSVITNPSWQFFPAAVFIPATGNWHMATFFYESLWCVLAFILLFWYQRKSKKQGSVFALYLLVYGFERMIVEGFRLDSLYWGPIRVSQLLSAVLFVGAAAYFITLLIAGKREAALADGADDSLDIAVSSDEEKAECPEEKVEKAAVPDKPISIPEEKDDDSEEIGENLWAQDDEAYHYDESELKAEAVKKEISDSPET